MSRWNDLGDEPQGYPFRPRARAKGGLLAGLAKIGFAVGAVAAVSGAVYLGVRHSATIPDEASLPLVKADPRPLKNRPQQPGGMAVPDQDKLVFDRLAPDSAPPMVEHLLPPPEQPLPRPVAAAAPLPPALPLAAASNDPAAKTPVGAASPRTLSDKALEPPPQPAKADRGASAPAGAGPNGGPNTGLTPAPNAAGVKPAKPGSGTATAPALSGALPGALPSSGAAAAGGGPARIQLGSLLSEADAQSEWKRLQHRYPQQLGGLKPSIQRVDLGEKGIRFRLQAGPLDETKARTLCTELQSQKVGCQLVHR